VLRHCVLISWTDESSAEDREAACSAIAGLTSAIPEIRSMTIGADAGVSPGNGDMGIVADFDDEEAYLTYARHPAHLQIIQTQIKPILKNRAAVQFHV